jgi:hypothetical protein
MEKERKVFLSVILKKYSGANKDSMVIGLECLQKMYQNI